MSSIIKPRIPQIDHDNPLTRGLVFDAPLWETGGNTTKELVKKLSGTIVASGATWDKNLYGKDLDFSVAASSVSYTTPSSLNNLNPISIEALFLIRGTGGGGLGRIVNKLNAGTGYFQFYMTSNLSFASAFSTTNGVWYVSGVSFNVWHHGVVTYDGSSTSNIPTFYIDGVKKTTNVTSQSVGTRVADDTTLNIGNRPDGLRNWNGKIAYVRIWNRILTPTDAKTLYQNPFRIYKQNKYPIIANSGSTTITTKTQTGVSRIQLLTTKIISGIARITAVTIKTQSAITRIQEQVNKTITGLARITALTLKTIAAISRITAVTNKAQTGVSRITAVTVKTVSGIVRITVATLKTISAVSRITTSTLKTITGVTRITATSTKSQAGISRIGLITIKTINALSRIQEQVNKTITSIARITAVTIKTITSVARITAVTIRTTTAISRIAAIVNRTINAVARITTLTQKTISGIARITVISIKNQTAISRITSVVIRILTGISRISVIQMRTIIGKANLFVATIKTIPAKASIKETTIHTITATAHIKSAYGLYRKVSSEYVYAGKLLNRLGSLYYND